MKKAISLTFVISLLVFLVFVILEPESVSSATDPIDVSLTVTSEISISSPSNVSLSPNMAGMTGGSASGDATWTIKTSDSSGFSMTLKEGDAAPALSGQTQGDSFADYTPANASTPDWDWSVADSTAEFGFTIVPATAADAVADFLDDATSACGGGGASTQTTEKCWFTLNGTTEVPIINRSSETDYAGQAEKVIFKAQLYNSDGVPNDDAGMVIEDTYQATITATATMN